MGHRHGKKQLRPTELSDMTSAVPRLCRVQAKPLYCPQHLYLGPRRKVALLFKSDWESAWSPLCPLLAQALGLSPLCKGTKPGVIYCLSIMLKSNPKTGSLNCINSGTCTFLFGHFSATNSSDSKSAATLLSFLPNYFFPRQILKMKTGASSITSLHILIFISKQNKKMADTSQCIKD